MAKGGRIDGMAPSAVPQPLPTLGPKGGRITPESIERAGDRYVVADGEAARVSGADVIGQTFVTGVSGRPDVPPEVRRARELATKALIEFANFMMSTRRS